jgi:FlaA1/EpsC-like NDP-sugar epimerase
MKHNKLVIVGSGGHASVVLDAAKEMNRCDSYIVLDANSTSKIQRIRKIN